MWKKNTQNDEQKQKTIEKHIYQHKKSKRRKNSDKNETLWTWKKWKQKNLKYQKIEIESFDMKKSNFDTNAAKAKVEAAHKN